jgi:DNA (cytosine-5)-methyltransferase 1
MFDMFVSAGCAAGVRGYLMSYKFISLYAGAGGLDLGFVKAGFEPVWTNELNPVAAKTYEEAIRRYYPEHRVSVGDIRTQDLPKKGAAELVIGGPPCQGFSVAGYMDPSDPRSAHVWDFLDVVRAVKPTIFVMENVKALATNGKWQGVREKLFSQAHAMGYDTDLLVLNAAHYGVPQNRERMFLIGSRDVEIEEPRKVTRRQPPTIRHALARLPLVGSPGNASVCTARITPAARPVLRSSPFAGMLFNGHGRPLDVDAPAPTLWASMGGNQTHIVDQLQLESHDEPWVVGYHRRLIRGGRPNKRVPRRLRRLTVEEAAAIQSFPRFVRWHGTQTAQYRQIGNAVPPRLAFHVARAISRSLK